MGTARDLSPYLTTWGWRDGSVVHPNTRPGDGTSCLSNLKRMRGPLCLEEGGRPPVDLNSASRPVLVALIQGLKGKTEQTQRYQDMGEHEILAPMAGAIAQAILAARPFATWEDFARTCDGLVASGVISGYTVSAVVYGLNATTPTNLDQVAFTISPVAATTVKIQLAAAGSWYSCTNTAGSVTCNTTAPQATVAAATQLTVVATQ